MTMTFAWQIFVGASLLYFVTINLGYTVLTVFSYFRSALNSRQAKVTNFDQLSTSHLTPPISIVIPAYNEEPVIVNSVSTALEVTYPEFEIIVVNDGSTDRTLRKLIETFELEGSERPYRAALPSNYVRRVYQSKIYPNLFVMDKENGGKADALNAGVNLSRYRYVCNTDADTLFEKESLLHIVRPVARDPRRVVAVGGQVRVGNGFLVQGGEIVSRGLPKQLLPLLQIIEYMRTFLGNRVGWSSLNAMLLISGAFGFWRRDLLISVGGFNRDITGEDLELTMRFHRVLRARNEEYQVASLPDPVCWTEAPQDLRSYYQQRNRWHRVLLESYWSHRDMLLNPAYGTVGMLAMPYYLFFEILGPFMEVFSYLVVFVGFGLGVLEVETMMLFLLLAVGYTTFLNLAALVIEELHYQTYTASEMLRLVIVGFADNLGYRQLTMLIRVVATFDWLRGTKAWGEMSRSGYSEPSDTDSAS
jgi:cellulose synthase/poly-beta-1,6-N-acetylglucosamine synthase-like glycosyltransferase